MLESGELSIRWPIASQFSAALNVLTADKDWLNTHLKEAAVFTERVDEWIADDVA